MNQKGLAVISGIVLLVTAVIGVVLVDSVNQPLWQTSANVNESSAPVAVNGTTYTMPQCAPEMTQIYDNTNATVLGGAFYEFTSGANQWTLGDNASGYAGTNLTITYTGNDCDSYLDNAVTRTVMENFILLVGVMVLGLGGAWLYFKG